VIPHPVNDNLPKGSIGYVLSCQHACLWSLICAPEEAIPAVDPWEQAGTRSCPRG